MMKLTRSLGLLLLGFLSGAVFSQLAQYRQVESFDEHQRATSKDQFATASSYSDYQGFSVLSATKAWDVLKKDNYDGRQLALGQNGLIRVVIIDDQTSLHIMSYNDKGPAWQGRLMDVGNDGTVEVADISGGRCEKFARR